MVYIACWSTPCHSQMTSGPVTIGLHALSPGASGKSAGSPGPADAAGALTSPAGAAEVPESLLHIAAVVTSTAPSVAMLRSIEVVMSRILGWGRACAPQNRAAASPG